MSFKSDAEVAANIQVGGTDRSALFYDSVAHIWYTKDQAGTLAPLVNGVSTFNGRTGTVLPLQADYDSFFLTLAEGNASYQPLDSDLTAIAALTTTSYGRSLLTLANATALAAEVDVFFLTPAEGNASYQPLDSDLTAIAALATTSYGRGLLTYANAAALAADMDSFFLTLAEGNAAYQPLDATLTALAGVNWAANSLAIGTNTDTVTQVTFAANTFPARSSSGNLVAKPITDAGLAFMAAADAAAETALLNPSTPSLKGLMSAVDKSRSDNWYNKAVFNVLDNGISPANSGSTNVTAWNALMTTIAGIDDTATIVFPPSSSFYDFASVCAIPAGLHLRILGHGPTTRTSEAFGTIIRTTSATADIFSCGDWYQEFENLHFRTSTTRSGGAAILSNDNIAINVYNCNFHQMFNGISYSGGVNSGNVSIIDNCGFTDTVNFSIQVDGTNANAIIVNCVADCTVPAVAHLELNACGSLLVAECDFIRATNNLRLNPNSGTKGVFSTYFNQVFFDTASGSSVKFMGGAAGCNVQRVKFVSCWFSGSANGCEFAANTSTNKATGIDFVSCDIYSNSTNGILATEVQDFSMSNCRVASNITAGLNLLATAGAVTKVNIQNNTFGPTAGVGANGIGINIQAGAYGAISITGNLVVGNTGNNNIIDPGSTVPSSDLKLISDNLGHLLKGAIATLASPLSIPITTETLVLSARIPANAVAIGQVFKFKALGVMSAANAVTWKCRVGTGGTAADTPIVWTSILGAVGAANCRHGCDGTVTVRAIGAGGAVQAEGLQHRATAAVTSWDSTVVAVAATGAIATNAVWFIDITLTQTIGTSIIQQAYIEAL